jgi:uncharacterized cupredoxin-like copper-binding protein
MKKILPVLILGALPTLALASGDHAGGHDMRDMKQMSHEMESMSHGEHDNSAGQPGDPAKVNRVVEISMDDSMRFTPGVVNVKAGETIRFFIKNNGKLSHEMVIGSMEELKEHAAMMRNMPGMKHAEPNMITLAAGQRGGIVWQFDKAGAVDFACLVPGHMEAGMTGKVMVE